MIDHSIFILFKGKVQIKRNIWITLKVKNKCQIRAQVYFSSFTPFVVYVLIAYWFSMSWMYSLIFLNATKNAAIRIAMGWRQISSYYLINHVIYTDVRCMLLTKSFGCKIVETGEIGAAVVVNYSEYVHMSLNEQRWEGERESYEGVDQEKKTNTWCNSDSSWSRIKYGWSSWSLVFSLLNNPFSTISLFRNRLHLFY